VLLFLCAAGSLHPAQPFFDREYPSQVFHGPRQYRIFLPADYDASRKSYPAIYYFHGHSDRYTLEKYDQGTDTVPKIAAFVAAHDAIVVAPDGYVPRTYTGFYGGSPWDIQAEEVEYDFGEYFRELVAWVDGHYRTLPDRRHRATAGLSMGGYMSLWLSARYPELIGSASAFNPGPEFYAGEAGRRVLWRPKDHVRNHEETMVRLVRASGDYISQYTEETHLAYARAPRVTFEFRQDEYHRHWATSIGETFDFHMRAFAHSALDRVPVEWSHADPYQHFSVWGYEVTSTGPGAAITYLDDVNQGGLRVSTRKWAPDGPPAERAITIVTPPLYRAGAVYTAGAERITADAHGRLMLHTDGAGRQISIQGPGTGEQELVLLPFTAKDVWRVAPDSEVHLPVRIYNPRTTAFKDLTVSVKSGYPTVQLHSAQARVAELQPGETVDLAAQLTARFVAGDGYFAPARLTVDIGGKTHDVDIAIAPAKMDKPLAVEILDGRSVTLPVFRQKGNQGGGGPIQRSVHEGRGNGNGILEPGEEATIWVKLDQGMDPFDKGNWYRAKIYSDSPWLTEVADIAEPKQLEWTSAKERTSVVRLSPDTPRGTVIPLILDNESWSFQWTPDVRYGVEPLYQAFQLHTHHLHRFEITVGTASKRGR
jgi:pimeloyl-ACP methyl ester carboxylesterase